MLRFIVAVSGSLQADVIVLFVQSQLHCMTFVVLLRFRALLAERRAQKELHIAHAPGAIVRRWHCNRRSALRSSRALLAPKRDTRLQRGKLCEQLYVVIARVKEIHLLS